jgi:hypothetical protein
MESLRLGMIWSSRFPNPAYMYNSQWRCKKRLLSLFLHSRALVFGRTINLRPRRERGRNSAHFVYWSLCDPNRTLRLNWKKQFVGQWWGEPVAANPAKKTMSDKTTTLGILFNIVTGNFWSSTQSSLICWQPRWVGIPNKFLSRVLSKAYTHMRGTSTFDIGRYSRGLF